MEAKISRIDHCFDGNLYFEGYSIMNDVSERPAEQDKDPGLAAYQRGDYAAAFAEWRKLAENGHPQACHNLAILYLNGQGTEADAAAAEQWCRRSAELGHPPAQHHLGVMLLESDSAAALPWWRKAAENGVADAQFFMAEQYRVGGLVDQDLDAAADWFEAAALQGQVPAQFNLGVLYANAGHLAQAKLWWEKAEAAGSEEAAAALAKLRELSGK